MMFEESTFYQHTTQIQELHSSSFGCFNCNWLVWIVVVPSFLSQPPCAPRRSISGDEATLHRGSWRMPRYLQSKNPEIRDFVARVITHAVAILPVATHIHVLPHIFN
jgi:hypothetical protein